MDNLGKQEMCQLFLQQEVAKGLACGKSKPTIGREIRKWLGDHLGVDYKARTIERRARRIAADQESKKEIGTNVPTVENSMEPGGPEPKVEKEESDAIFHLKRWWKKAHKKDRKGFIELVTKAKPSLALLPGESIISIAESKVPDPAKFKDRFKINPEQEKACQDLIEVWDRLSDKEPNFHQATAVRILMRRMAKRQKELFLSTIYNSIGVESPELESKLYQANKEIRKYKEQQAGMDRTNLKLQNRILELKDALKESGGIDPGETEQERFFRLHKVISREQVKEDLGAEGATPEAPEKSEAEQELIEKQHAAHVDELEAKIDELMKVASVVPEERYDNKSVIGRAIIRNLEKIPKSDLERRIAFNAIVTWIRQYKMYKLPPDTFIRALPHASELQAVSKAKESLDTGLTIAVARVATNVQEPNDEAGPDGINNDAHLGKVFDEKFPAP